MKIGKIRPNIKNFATCRTALSKLTRGQKSPHNRKLTESFICVQFETVFFTFSIVRTM